jgi:hypothetical protein
MEEVWELPAADVFQPTGHEWLLQVLISIHENQRVNTMMILWRVWHSHNEMTHGKACRYIKSSRRFLISYLNSLFLIKQFPTADVEKGKVFFLTRG